MPHKRGQFRDHSPTSRGCSARSGCRARLEVPGTSRDRATPRGLGDWRSAWCNCHFVCRRCSLDSEALTERGVARRGCCRRVAAAEEARQSACGAACGASGVKKSRGANSYDIKPAVTPSGLSLVFILRARTPYVRNLLSLLGSAAFLFFFFFFFRITVEASRQTDKPRVCCRRELS